MLTMGGLRLLVAGEVMGGVMRYCCCYALGRSI